MNTLNVVRKLALQAGVVAIALTFSAVEAHAQNVSRSTSSRISVSQPNVSTSEVELPEITTSEVELPEAEASVSVHPGGAVAVPEPSTAAGLLVMGAVGAGVMWRRKKVIG